MTWFFGEVGVFLVFFVFMGYGIGVFSFFESEFSSRSLVVLGIFREVCFSGGGRVESLLEKGGDGEKLRIRFVFEGRLCGIVWFRDGKC